MQVVRQEEANKSQEQNIRTKRNWQLHVIALAALKYYLVSCELQTNCFFEIIQLDTKHDKVEHEHGGIDSMMYTKTLPQSSMFIFACIIYGNLIDNHNK